MSETDPVKEAVDVVNDAKIEQHIAAVIKNLEEIIGENQITVLNVISLCINSMQFVEKIPELSGQEKKNIVIESLKRLIAKMNCDTSILALIPDFIDTAVKIEKGAVKISLDAEDVIGCCSAICGSASKTQSRKK